MASATQVRVFSAVVTGEPGSLPAHGRASERREGLSIVRRPEREQGIALEILAHAIEYLVDSRMFLTGTPYTRAESDALRILATSSRGIFEDCPEVVPLRLRVTGWLRSQLGAAPLPGVRTH